MIEEESIETKDKGEIYIQHASMPQSDGMPLHRRQGSNQSGENNSNRQNSEEKKELNQRSFEQSSSTMFLKETEQLQEDSLNMEGLEIEAVEVEETKVPNELVLTSHNSYQQKFEQKSSTSKYLGKEIKSDILYEDAEADV